MSRSKWKGLYIKACILKPRLINSKKINIWSRESTIPFSLLNKNVFVHTGKNFKKIVVTREKIGFKFGEFVFTKNIKKKGKNNNYGSKSKRKY